MRRFFSILIPVVLLTVFLPLTIRAQEARNIEIFEDRDQDYMTTRIYEIKNGKVNDLRPFIDGAVRRANPESNVQRLNYKAGKKQFISVTMPTYMVKLIDDMVIKLDHVGGELDDEGSNIEGTGITTGSYSPEHRSTAEMLAVMRTGIFDSGEGRYFRDPETNTFYWKDSRSDGATGLKWIQALDRPVPQMEVEICAYQINETDLKELGVDFVAWKNGPGANLFGAGLDYLDLASFTDASNAFNIADIAGYASHTWAGFAVAPQFDATFLRLLTEKGKAKVATSGSLTVVNDWDVTQDDFGNTSNPAAFASARYRLRFSPDFQSITKNPADQTISLGTTSPEFRFYLRNPIINFEDAGNPEHAAIISFGWNLDITDLIDKTNDGTEIINEYVFQSQMQLAAGTEKLLAQYDKEHLVKQKNAFPWLGEMPVLEYILGAAEKSKVKTKIIITVKASPVSPERDLSEFAGKVIEAVDMAAKNESFDATETED